MDDMTILKIILAINVAIIGALFIYGVITDPQPVECTDSHLCRW